MNLKEFINKLFAIHSLETILNMFKTQFSLKNIFVNGIAVALILLFYTVLDIKVQLAPK